MEKLKKGEFVKVENHEQYWNVVFDLESRGFERFNDLPTGCNCYIYILWGDVNQWCESEVKNRNVSHKQVQYSKLFPDEEMYNNNNRT
jgi:hypothetical protein